MRYGLVVIFLFFILAPPVANATLGGTTATIEADRAQLKALHPAPVVHATFTVHTLQSDWVTIREYASSDGKVFAVAWQGNSHPDLQSLLGDFWPEYRSAAHSLKQKRGQRSRLLRSTHIVVHTGGHMRSLFGRAYVNPLPSGVKVSDIR